MKAPPPRRPYCDGCAQDRPSVQACGHDANGDPDAPDLCSRCRFLLSKGRIFDRKLGRYVSIRLRDLATLSEDSLGF